MKKDQESNSIIIIIENCGECPFCERACAGNKPVCGNSKILSSRPYGTDRRIKYDTIPTWCPFKVRGE